MNEESFYDKHNKYLLTKRRNFIFRILTIIILWTLLIAYLVLPVSKISNVKIDGNVFFTKKDIFNIASLDEKQYRIDINDKQLSKKLNSHPYIKDAYVDINIFSSVIEIKEIYPLGKYQNRILWSDGTFSSVPIDERVYGTLPEIEATINEFFIEDFSSADSKWGTLRKNTKMVLIEEKEYPLTEKNSYTYHFKEIIDNQEINLSFVIDKASATKKLDLTIYNYIVEEIRNNPTYIIDGKVVVGYTDSNYSYWRI